MTKYVRFTFENLEPLKVADDSSSQSGQVNVLSYIPGSAIRGALIDAFAKAGKLGARKKILLSDQISFLNAYIMRDGKELIPSVKGFYEDKTESNDKKEIENILLTGENTPGYKRATVGKYCYIKDDCIYYSHVKMGSDMKINKGKGSDQRTVFRNQYISPGQQFAAYIAVHGDDSSALMLKEILDAIREKGTFLLGGSRSFGYGNCEIREIGLSSDRPYDEYCGGEEMKNQAYMLLLSNASMRNEEGESIGIDTETLRKILGLSHLEIQYSATSVVDVRGYNRTWKTWTPSVKMYEMGSVFKLKFEGEEIPHENLMCVMDEGLGIRTNEGYGRVIFLTHYEKIKYKREIIDENGTNAAEEEKLDSDEEKTLFIAAKGYYRNLIRRAVNAYLANEENSFKGFGLNGTQLGTIESILYANLYRADAGKEELTKYFNTDKKKDEGRRIQKVSKKRGDIAEYINNLWETSLPELLKKSYPDFPCKVMGLKYDKIFSEKEIIRIKNELIISQIKRMNRGENGDD